MGHDSAKPFSPAILDYVADDGSLEYTHYISFNETDGRYFGKEIVFSFLRWKMESQKRFLTKVRKHSQK